MGELLIQNSLFPSCALKYSRPGWPLQVLSLQTCYGNCFKSSHVSSSQHRPKPIGGHVLVSRSSLGGWGTSIFFWSVSSLLMKFRCVSVVWRCLWNWCHNGAISFWQVEKNFLNGKLKAITAYFEEQDSVDVEHWWSGPENDVVGSSSPCSPWEAEGHGHTCDALSRGKFGMENARVFKSVGTMSTIIFARVRMEAKTWVFAGATNLGHLLPGE